jgi:flagellin
MFSTIPGKDGKVVLTELGSPDSSNTLKKILDIDPIAYENGVGQYAFTMHVKDTSIQFQIGPNQGHTAKANIIRTDCKALGIEDLDLTTVKSSEIAIGLIDKALQRISSERAKLGAIENRMTYTNNSLRVALQNMTASESRIRDVDMAAEVIEMTQSQILQQASNAMVGQANVSAQAVLDLLR